MKYLIAAMIVGWIIKKFVKEWNSITIFKPNDVYWNEEFLHKTFKEEKEAYTIAPPIEEVLKGRK